MKRIFVVALALSFFSVGFVNAEEKQNTEGWKPTAEFTLDVRNAYIDEFSGNALFRKTVLMQSAIIGVEKKATGFYVQAKNFTPSEKELRETDFYAGFYTEAVGIKIDAGYAYYWEREDSAINFHAVYGTVVFPSCVWQITPFFNAEYRFAEKKDADEDLNGFLYYGGLRREFKIYERMNLMTEISLGGNTGIYGMAAENLSFAREKIEFNIFLMDQLKLILGAMTQQNMGKEEGMASDTDRLFVTAAISITI